MNAITVSKSWKEILPEPAAENLLKLFDASRQQNRSAEAVNKAPSCLFLFDGNAKENKAAAAALAGLHLGEPTLRINLSEIVSKYMGETEKNIDAVFSKAADKKWILFFDEADALFGKRTDVKDSHDKYANQAASYLLQKISAYKGTVILSTDKKEMIAPFILHNIGNIIHFPIINKM